MAPRRSMENLQFVATFALWMALHSGLNFKGSIFPKLGELRSFALVKWTLPRTASRANGAFAPRLRKNTCFLQGHPHLYIGFAIQRQLLCRTKHAQDGHLPARSFIIKYGNVIFPGASYRKTSLGEDGLYLFIYEEIWVGHGTHH